MTHSAMKTIGLLGGMSWESTLLYYKLVNEAVRRRLGGLHSARIAMISVDFAPYERLQVAGDWEEIERRLADESQRLVAAGAQCIVLCTNTMHKVAAGIQAVVGVPLLHIADATARAIQARNVRRVGLLGTRFTMEQEFYAGRLSEVHGLEVLVPDAEEREVVHRVIYDELVVGVVRPQSRERYVRIVEHLRERGAQGVIAGCTEIGMLLRPEDCSIPLFDTTAIHAESAVEWALS